MKVVIYSRVFAPEIGGVETLVMSLAEGLARSDARYGGAPWDITVVTPTPARGFEDSLPFRVVRRPSLRQFLRLLREADIVHLAGPALLPLLFGLFLGKPVVIEHHGFQTICPNGQLHYEPTQMPCPGHFMARRHWECLRCNSKYGSLQSLKMWLLTFPRRWLCYGASRNITPTGWLASVLKLPRSTTVLHGVRNHASGADAKTPPPPTFAFLGRLVSTKGVHILLEAAQRLKEKGLVFQLKIIGDGPERRNLEARTGALQLEDRVTFLGHLPPGKLEETLAQARAIVVPSLGGEVFGLVAAENMMRGRLLIVSEIGALAEVVGDAGLRFSPGDVEGLAGCMQRVLESPELVAEFGRKAWERAAHLFAQERMVEDHKSVYREVVSRKG